MISILVISYNTREMTLTCLRSVFEQTPEEPFELLVVDNASEDGSADAIEQEFGSRLKLIRSAENIGFAAANNLAAEHATGEYLLLLNPDTVVLDRAIERLVAFARQHPDHGIYGGRTVFADGSLNIASCWAAMSLWSLFCRAVGLSTFFPRSRWLDTESLGPWDRDSVREVDIVVGCFLLIPRTLWEQLGGFNLKYWMYGEEADLCFRARDLGYRPVITPDATIIHHVGAATTASGRKAAQVAKAKATLLRDHWPPLRRRIGLGLMWCWGATRRLAAEILYRLRGGRMAEQRETWKQVWDGRRDWLAGY